MATETDTSTATGRVPSTEECIDALIHVLPRVARAFKSQLRSSKLGTQHVFLLMTIAELEQIQRDGAQPGELARRAWLSGAAITAELDGLVADGYCVRAHSEKDRRKVLVQLTPKGYAVLDEVHDQARQLLRDLLEGWDGQRRTELCRVLHDLDGLGGVLLRTMHSCPERA
jgi:DNA-binding MarR family transcriptional regulator